MPDFVAQQVYLLYRDPTLVGLATEGRDFCIVSESMALSVLEDGHGPLTWRVYWYVLLPTGALSTLTHPTVHSIRL